MTIPHKPFGELSDAEKGALLLAAWRGEKVERLGPVSGEWDASFWPSFYPEIIYRIAPEPLTPDSIDWSHVAPEWVFMARNSFDQPQFFANFPPRTETGWGHFAIDHPSAAAFASYRRGTVDWKDSLIVRPGCAGKP